jgi:hypothetical protein
MAGIKQRLENLEKVDCDRSSLLPVMVTTESEPEWTPEQRANAERHRRNGYAVCTIDDFV